MALLLFFSAPAAQAVRQGLHLCAASVIPSLFPFFVLSSLFVSTKSTAPPGHLQRVASRISGCSNNGISAFFLSLLGGYPLGARLIGQMYRAGQLSREESEHLLLFGNNAGPAFILGFVGLGQMGSLRLGVYLYLIHAASAALIAVLSRPKRPYFAEKAAPSVAPPPFSQALVRAIGDAGSTMVQVCAFVTFFCTVLQLFSQFTRVSHPLLLGFVELTGGILRLSGGQRDFVSACFLLGWGGLSVHCQTAAMLADTDLSLVPHWKGKFLQGLLAAFLGFFAWFLIK